MREWSEELIERTIKEWQPHAEKVGEKLTREDAIEILNNVTELFDLLFEMYQADKKRDSEVSKARPQDVNLPVVSSNTHQKLT